MYYICYDYLYGSDWEEESAVYTTRDALEKAMRSLAFELGRKCVKNLKIYKLDPIDYKVEFKVNIDISDIQ